MPSIRVDLPRAAHDIVIEHGALGRLGALVREVAPARRTVLACDDAAAIGAVHAPMAAASLVAAGFDLPESVALCADEREKTIDATRRVYDAMLGAGLDRSSPLVVLGGGLVGDVAGFAAATFKRGVPHVLAPTTLLAMVDAAIGGKTGVNLPAPGARAAGAGGQSERGEAPPMLKNIVGAFWQPRRVVVDPQTLRTLPARELRCGLAECVKHAIVGDPGLLPWLETHVDKVLELDPASIEALIARSVAVKVRLVVADETEQGERALLNLGHTFGHAIEPIERCGLRHGEAVAIGLCAAMHVATTRGVFPRRDVDRIEALLRRIGLPTRVVLLGDDGRHRAEGGLDRGALLRAMGHDKKNRDGRVRLVLPLAIGRAALVDDATPAEIHAAWDRVGV